MPQPATAQRTVDATPADAAVLPAKAWALSPLLTAQAADNETAGSLNATTLAALRDGGFLGMWVPRCFGGAEAWPTPTSSRR